MVHLSASQHAFETLDDICTSIATAGTRLSNIEASEGAAGNISVLYARNTTPDGRFSDNWEMPSPVEVPELAGAWIAVTGSGRRLRELQSSTEANVALVEVLDRGNALRVHASPSRMFEKPTSELNTHLALHQHHAAKTGEIHTVIHAQPLHLTFLSHTDGCRDTMGMNKRILRWHPELIHMLYDGIGVAPLLAPGSDSLMRATLELSHKHRVIVWACHGTIARYSGSVQKACDLIEYAETGARYEFMNLPAGEKAQGIPIPDLLRLCEEIGIKQTVFAEA